MNIVPTQIRGFNLQFTESELAGLIDDLPRESRYRGPLIAARNGAFDEETPSESEEKKNQAWPSPKSRSQQGPRIRQSHVPGTWLRQTPGRAPARFTPTHEASQSASVVIVCPRCEIVTDGENPFLPDKQHCAWCEFELTATAAERARALDGALIEFIEAMYAAH